MDDEVILQKFRDGDGDAFRALVEKYQKMVYIVSYGFVKNSRDAEDITQDVFFAAYKNIRKFKHESKVSTWIYRIAVNRSLNFVRKKKLLSLFSVRQDEETMPDIPAEEDAHPDFTFEKSEKGRIIKKALDGLPENQRTAFILSNVEGFSYQEIAEIMQCSVSAVESRIHRAKMSLQKKLVQYLK